MEHYEEDGLTPEEERDAAEYDLIQSRQEDILSNENLEPKVQKDFLKGLGEFLIQQKAYSVQRASKVIMSVGNRLNYLTSAISDAVDYLIDFIYGPI